MLRSVHSFDRFEIAGVEFDFALKDQVAAIVQRWKRAGRRHYISITNPHSVMLCHRDSEMRLATQRAALTLPDGVGVIIAARLLGYGRRHRATGPATMLAVCDQGRTLGFRHYFYGGGEGVAEQLAHRLCRDFPGLQVAGTCAPPFRPLAEQEDARIVAQINAACADIVWIGLGAPKQEKWMLHHVGRIHATAMIGVGAAFDFHSGRIPWAPAFVRKAGLEWAWRLARDPLGMLRRNLDSPAFLARVFKQAICRRLNRSFPRTLSAYTKALDSSHRIPVPPLRNAASGNAGPISAPQCPGAPAGNLFSAQWVRAD